MLVTLIPHLNTETCELFLRIRIELYKKVWFIKLSNF